MSDTSLKSRIARRLNADTRGVSPVIGVVLMIAVTVILASTIGVFVLGLGDNLEQTPQASWGAEQSNGNLTITHERGDDIDASSISITVNGSAAAYAGGGFSGTITAGDSVTITNAGNGATVRIVYDAGDSTAILKTIEVEP